MFSEGVSEIGPICPCLSLLSDLSLLNLETQFLKVNQEAHYLSKVCLIPAKMFLPIFPFKNKCLKTD